MTLVTRYDDVKEVLEQPNVFDVTYKSKIELIMDGGNIFLGMNDTEEARRDKANMRLAAPPAEALSLVGPRTDTLARAALADDDALVAKYVFEASRYYPLTPGLIRQSTADYRIAAGTRRAKTIRKGRRVVAATRSAMFDGRRVSEPLSFRLDRPDSNYMHFGHGMHECFGLHMNRVQVPAICKAVLKRPGLRRAVGDTGKLQMKGIFSTILVVEFDS